MLEDGFSELSLNGDESRSESLSSVRNETHIDSNSSQKYNIEKSDCPDSCQDFYLGTGKSDSFQVKITNPSKVGEGMSAYFVYQVNSKYFGKDFSVSRRFSDFLGLHEKLATKHVCEGIIVPPAPTKDVLGTTKVKISKDLAIENEFIERRRLALERFITRLLNHPILRSDPDLREFLEKDNDLSRATNTQLLSSASAKKMMKNFGDALGKLTYRMDDPQEYFFQKSDQLDNWEKQLKKLYAAFTSLVATDHDLANSKLVVSRAISSLANVEENTGLAQALGRLSETEEHVGQLYAMQAEAEFCHLAECARDTLGMIQSCKDVLGERIKAFRAWKAADALLSSKQEQKVRIEVSPKCDTKKLAQLTLEIEEMEKRVDSSQEKFNKISDTIKREFSIFDVSRLTDFKNAAIEYLETVLQIQSKILESWESYRDHAKSIN